MAPKPDYGTQLKELKDLVWATNTKLTSIEDWITSNHDDLMARIANNEIRLNDALSITKKNIIMKQYTEKKIIKVSA